MSSTSRPVFGPERPPTGPASRPKDDLKAREVTTYQLGGESTSNAPPLDTKGMSCIDFQLATGKSDEEIEPYILALIDQVGGTDEASWRAAHPELECPTEEEISAQMNPHIPAANFPTSIHYTEVWKDKKWADKHGNAPYEHTFAVRASTVFAKRAEGEVIAILPKGNGGEKTWYLMSLWNLELKILMDNPKVTSILRIDVDGNGSEMKAL